MANFLVKKGLQAGYNALAAKDAATVYFCTDTGNMYLGDVCLFESSALKGASLSGKVVTFTTHGASGTAGSATLDLSTFATGAELTAAVATINADIDDLKNRMISAEGRLDTIEEELPTKVASVGAGDGLQVDGTATAPIVNLKLDGATLVKSTTGLKVADNTFDAYGDAAQAKADVIGVNGDAASANTIYGAKKYTDKQIATAIASTFRYKGSCKYSELPSDTARVGDVWNVTDAHDQYPAGTNYAWDGAAWDPLMGLVDLTPYLKSEDAAATYETIANCDTIRTNVAANAAAIQVLNGDSSVAGSVDKKVADAIAAEVTRANAAYDAIGAAATAKSDVIGASTDAKEANTIYGAKKYADYAAQQAAAAAVDALEISAQGDELVSAARDTTDKKKINVAATTALTGAVAKANSALQAADITTGSDKGKISVKGTDVAVNGLGSAAFENKSAFDESGAAATAKSEVIGTAADTASADTIHGAKKYADDAVAAAAPNYATAAQGAKADSALQTVSAAGAGYVSAEFSAKANNTQALSVGLTMQTIGAADGDHMGLAEASDVKSYVDQAITDANLKWGEF